MDQTDKQNLLSLLANDIKRIVQREIQVATKKASSSVKSYSSIMSNSIIDSNSVYSDFNIRLNQESYTNDSAYQTMKNKIQYNNSTSSKTFINKGSKKEF